MERNASYRIVVKDFPGGNEPHSISIVRTKHLRTHPSFEHLRSEQPIAVIRNAKGFIIGGLEVDIRLLDAENLGGAERRIARIDVCDALEISRDIIDN